MVALIRWRQLHWAEYAAELLGTALLVFVGLSAVVFNFSADLPIEQWIPDCSSRLLLTGLMFTGTGSLIAISPLGKLSGAHINPALSLAFWVRGKMHRIDFIGYVFGQFLGAILGATVLIGIWKEYATNVKNGMTLPSSSYSLGVVFFAEVSMTFLLVFAIFIFLSQHRLLRWTPLMTWLLVATMVWLESPISGTSLNPARSFGPAFVSGNWQDQWIYGIAPSLGSLLAVGAFNFLKMIGAHKQDILTCKLFHVPYYRSIFKNVSAPCRRESHS